MLDITYTYPITSKTSYASFIHIRMEAVILHLKKRLPKLKRQTTVCLQPLKLNISCL